PPFSSPCFSLFPITPLLPQLLRFDRTLSIILELMPFFSQGRREYPTCGSPLPPDRTPRGFRGDAQQHRRSLRDHKARSRTPPASTFARIIASRSQEGVFASLGRGVSASEATSSPYPCRPSCRPSFRP